MPSPYIERGDERLEENRIDLLAGIELEIGEGSGGESFGTVRRRMRKAFHPVADEHAIAIWSAKPTWFREWEEAERKRR